VEDDVRSNFAKMTALFVTSSNISTKSYLNHLHITLINVCSELFYFQLCTLSRRITRSVLNNVKKQLKLVEKIELILS